MTILDAFIPIHDVDHLPLAAGGCNIVVIGVREIALHGCVKSKFTFSVAMVVLEFRPINGHFFIV